MKKVKKIVSGGLAALLLATSLLVAFFAFLGFGGKSKPTDTVTVSAEDDVDTGYGYSDDNFEILEGVGLLAASEEANYFSTGTYVLSYSITLKNEAFRSFNLEKDFRTYCFTLYRVGTNGEQEAISRIIYTWTYGTCQVFEQKISAYNDVYGTVILPDQHTRGYVANAEELAKLQKNYANNVTVLAAFTSNGEATYGNPIESDFVWTEDDRERYPYLRFRVGVRDPHASYFIRFDYRIDEFSHVEKYGLFNLKKRNVYETTKGMMDSDVRSVYQWAVKCNEAGMLEEEVPNAVQLAELQTLIADTVTKDIRVQYLERIDGTPFAKKVEAKVTVPVWTTSIPMDTIAAALNRKDFCVLGAHAKEFVLDEAQGADVYVAQYSKSVWLKAQTADGNSANYFLDVNLSYEDYYGKMVTDYIFSSDVYEYVLNEIKNKYRATANLKADEIYGHWGYVVIPETASLSSLWAELFGDTSFNGTTVNYKYVENLSLSAYNKLLDEYGYSWLKKAWNSVAEIFDDGAYVADHYLFFADVEGGSVIISDSGASDVMDNDGALKNDVEESVETMKNFISDVGDKISEKADENDRMLKALLGVGVIGALGCAVVWVIAKLRSSK